MRVNISNVSMFIISAPEIQPILSILFISFMKHIELQNSQFKSRVKCYGYGKYCPLSVLLPSVLQYSDACNFSKLDIINRIYSKVSMRT